jgi:hypothetical protein
MNAVDIASCRREAIPLDQEQADRLSPVQGLGTVNTLTDANWKGFV